VQGLEDLWFEKEQGALASELRLSLAV